MRIGQLQHLLLHSSSLLHLSVSAYPSRRNVECVGEWDLQLTPVVRKRMLASESLSEQKSFSSIFHLPGHFSPRRTKRHKAESRGALNEVSEVDTALFGFSHSVVWQVAVFLYTENVTMISSSHVQYHRVTFFLHNF